MFFVAVFVALLKRSPKCWSFALLRHDGHAPTGGRLPQRGVACLGGGGHPGGTCPRRGVGSPVRLRPGALGVVVAAAQRARGQPLSVFGTESFLCAAPLTLTPVVLLEPGQWAEAQERRCCPRTQPLPRASVQLRPCPMEAAETWTGVCLLGPPLVSRAVGGERVAFGLTPARAATVAVGGFRTSGPLEGSPVECGRWQLTAEWRGAWEVRPARELHLGHPKAWSTEAAGADESAAQDGSEPECEAWPGAQAEEWTLRSGLLGV